MEDHETRRKIIRPWISLPKNKRQAAFAGSAPKPALSVARQYID
jgi:hypothetical protein